MFISHARSKRTVEYLAALIEAAGARSFHSGRSISPGEDFEARILRTIRKCLGFVVVLTPWSVTRPYVWTEFGIAWDEGKRIVGIVDGMTIGQLTRRAEIPLRLRRIQLVTLGDVDRYISGLRRRVRRVS